MTNDRLDAIENDLETVKQLLVSAARVTEGNSEAIDRLTDRVDRLTVNVDRLTDRVDRLTDRVDRLTDRVDRLTEDLVANIQDLSGTVVQMIEDAHENRTEIRRIWEYLLGQQNGNGRSEG